LVAACNSNGIYKPDNLRQVSKKEIITHAENKQTYSDDNVIYKNKIGIEISFDSITKISSLHVWITDKYVDTNNNLKVIVIRKATEDDKK